MGIAERLEQMKGPITAVQFAKLMRFDKTTVYRWIRKGLIPSISINGQIRLDPPALARFVRKHQFGYR